MKLPQLSVRDLFWLVLVVGMGCAWWVHRARLSQELTDIQNWSLYNVELPNVEVHEDTPLLSLPPWNSP